jgi:hypothetical protein
MAEPIRIARTESLFRDVNERIAETAQRFGSDDAVFVCECADPGCGERIPAPLDEYEQVRADGVRFLVAPGHEVPQYEHVVDQGGDFQVVAKTKDQGVAREARELDPRTDDALPPDQASEMK